MKCLPLCPVSQPGRMGKAYFFGLTASESHTIRWIHNRNEIISASGIAAGIRTTHIAAFHKTVVEALNLSFCK